MFWAIAIRSEDGIAHRHWIDKLVDDLPVVRHGDYIFPDEIAVGRHLEKMARGGRADKRVAVRQTMSARCDVTEEILAVTCTVRPLDLV